jgi:cell division protein ZapA
LNIAVLALLNVGEAYLRLHDAVQHQDDSANARLRDLVARLESTCPDFLTRES